MADTAALVIALSAQLTKFEKDMKQAGVMADDAVGKIEQKFSRMNPQVSASFFGNLFSNLVTKAIESAKQALDDLIERFKELQQVSKYTETNIQALYGLQEAFKQSGASAADANAAIKSIGLQLDQMQRGNRDNPLAQLFAANAQAMKGFKLETADAYQALLRVADIVRGLPDRQKLEVLQALGLPPGAVEALERGGAALDQMAQKAAQAAPDLHKIAEEAKAIKELFESMGTAIKNALVEGAFDMLKQDLKDLVRLASIFVGLFKEGPLDEFMQGVQAKIQGAAASFEKAQQAANNPPNRVFVTGGQQRGTSTNPFGLGGGAGSDFFQRQNDQIEKHIALMEADAKAVGLGAGAQEQLRTEAALYAALARDGITDTEKYADAIYKLSERAGQAADQLAKAQHQLAEINKLGNTLGQALSTAFADAILEGKKLNEVMSQLLKTLARAAINWAIMAPFQTGPGGAASPFASLFGFGKMAGGPVESGSSYLVGERGPELFTPGSSGMITPNSALRASPGGAGIFHYAPAIDARGASVEAVARLAQIMEADRAAFATRTVAVIQQARRARMPGL